MQNEEKQGVVRRDLVALSGYTFTTTVDELISKLKEEINKTQYSGSIEFKELDEIEGSSYWGVGWIDDYMTDEPEVTGISIYYEGDYVTQIECLPAKYGSGEWTNLTIPVNLYETAKRILGSETREWQEMMEQGVLTEDTIDVFTYEKVNDGEFYAGRKKMLYINRH